MKNLYILISNNGDGSSSVCATFDKDLIDEMERQYQADEIDFETWTDGDGFHYETWTVPDTCTPENMGFMALTKEDIFRD